MNRKVILDLFSNIAKKKKNNLKNLSLLFLYHSRNLMENCKIILKAILRCLINIPTYKREFKGPF